MIEEALERLPQGSMGVRKLGIEDLVEDIFRIATPPEPEEEVMPHLKSYIKPRPRLTHLEIPRG